MSEHNLDKGLQKTQQRVSRMEQQLQLILDKLENAKDNEKPPKSEDFLSELLGDNEDEYADTSVDKATLAKALTLLSDKLSGKLGEQVSHSIKSLREESQAEERVEQFWKRWEADHPDVAGQRDELLEKAESLVEDKYDHLQGDARMAAVRAAFDAEVEKAEATAGGPGNPRGSGGKPGRQAEKSDTEPGAEITPKGGKASGVKTDTDPEDEDLVLWSND